jgi:hypothetical protein
MVRYEQTRLAIEACMTFVCGVVMSRWYIDASLAPRHAVRCDQFRRDGEYTAQWMVLSASFVATLTGLGRSIFLTYTTLCLWAAVCVVSIANVLLPYLRALGIATVGNLLGASDLYHADRLSRSCVSNITVYYY